MAISIISYNANLEYVQATVHGLEEKEQFEFERAKIILAAKQIVPMGTIVMLCVKSSHPHKQIISSVQGNGDPCPRYNV